MNETKLFGATRTVVAARHALIAPDGHVPSVFPGWKGVTANVLISPAMGAGLSQLRLAFAQEKGEAVFPADEHEHAFYVVSGSVTVEWGAESVTLGQGGYAFAPTGVVLTIKGTDSEVVLFRKIHVAQAGHDFPPFIHGLVDDVAGEPFLGNPRALLKTLLPDDGRFDLAMNLFTYQPGATLPFVETHVMEHGLHMIAGQGVYRLEEHYYPVMSGDAIWMAPYCPQWFVAMGDEPASYLYYKDINRLP